MCSWVKKFLKIPPDFHCPGFGIKITPLVIGNSEVRAPVALNTTLGLQSLLIKCELPQIAPFLLKSAPPNEIIYQNNKYVYVLDYHSPLRTR